MPALIKEWRKGHRLWSVRFGIAAAILAGLQPILPHWQSVLPDWAFAGLASVVAAAGVVTRFIPQPKVHDDA